MSAPETSIREDMRLLGTDLQVRGATLKSIFAAVRRALDDGEEDDADLLCALGIEAAEAAANLGGRIEILSASIPLESAA